MNEFCEIKGITREFSVARTPQQNGVAERKNRTLIEAAKTMLSDSKLPTTFWAKAVNTACYVQNRMLVIKPHNKTPYELFLGRKPALSFMRPFGCPVTILNTLDHLGTVPNWMFDIDTLTQVYENINHFCREFKLRDKDANGNNIYKMFTLVNVVGSSCDNLSGSIHVNAATLPNADLPTDPLMLDLEDTANLLNTSIFSGAYDDEDVGAEADLNNLETTMNVSHIPTTRIHKDHPKEQIRGYPLSVPQTRRMTKSAQEHTMVSYIKKQRRTNHKDYQNCLFAYFLTQLEPKKVTQALTDPSWIEAMQDKLLQFRLQKVWRLVDLPKGKHAIGTKWVYRNKKDKRGIVMDVKSAFLYGIIEEEVYVYQTPSFEDPQFPNKVHKVEKALYGLHQAPKAWYETLSTYLLENGFKRGNIDKTLFIKKNKGELTFFLGLQVKQKDDGIFISQDKYVADILKKFDFIIVKTTSTPIKTNKAFLKDEEAEDVDVHLYRSMIRSLMYLIAYRPDIMFTVCACARDSPFDLEAFLDSDYAGASLDRKSTTGAEYVAAANCCGQVLWIQNQMLDYGFNFMNTKIYIDNESTICIVKNPVFHSKTKHIEIRHHFIRDSYEKRLIQVIKIHTDHNVADLLTKAFDVGRFQYLTASIGMLNP
ncbi:retrovirus-related pol polyprotein from transposon TNT 1-94 [Tanacetum coccineum]